MADITTTLEAQEPVPASTSPDAGTPERGNRFRMFTTALVASLLWAGLCNAVLDLLQSGGDIERLLGYSLDEARFIFFISSGVLWLILVATMALTNRLFLSMALLLSASVVVGFASYQKVLLRREPLYPADLAFARQTGFLTSMVGLSTVAVMVGVLGLLVVIVLLTGRILSRTFPPVRRRSEPGLWKRLAVARILAFVIAVTLLGYAAQFNSDGNRVRFAYEKAGAHWAFWFQEVNYGRHGFVAGFLYNFEGPAMETPPDYGADTMREVAARYSGLASQMNFGRDPSALDDVNVVMVLSEAFTDPAEVEGVRLDTDPLPFTRRLMSSTHSGHMLAQLFGGGTANMEFEALTGMSLSQFLPQMNTPYQMLVPDYEDFPSAVGLLRSRDHRAVAIHPYMTTMYKRYEVYPTLGFDDFIHEDTMASTDRIDDNQFISDAAAFDEVERQIQDAEKPLLVNLVTMQNHYPMAGNYIDPVPVQGVDGEVAEELSHYARGLHHTDNALRDFITSLETSPEKTAVIFYGDHAPAFWSGKVYDENGEDHFRRTPFFIWTNFASTKLPPAPVTSPIHFMPSLYNLVGAELPPYYALLSALHEEIPAMEQGEYFLPDGRKVTEEELNPRARALLEDYRLVQYDLSVGERYSQDELFYSSSE